MAGRGSHVGPMTPVPIFVISFAAFYLVSFLLELCRLVRRFDLAPLPAALGFVYHTLFFCQHHIFAEHPIGGVTMLFLAAAWGLVLVYLLWQFRYPNVPFGIFVLPLVLLLLGGGCLSVSTIETTGLSLRSLTKMLHVASAAGLVIAGAIWCICRVLYFLEVHLLRKKRALTPPTKLPSLEWSSTISRIALAIAVFCLCLCGLAIVLFTFFCG